MIDSTPIAALILLILVLLTPACTMDLGLPKGYLRPPIEDYKTVRVLESMPKGAEAIATVRPHQTLALHENETSSTR